MLFVEALINGANSYRLRERLVHAVVQRRTLDAVDNTKIGLLCAVLEQASGQKAVGTSILSIKKHKKKCGWILQPDGANIIPSGFSRLTAMACVETLPVNTAQRPWTQYNEHSEMLTTLHRMHPQ